MNRNTFLSACLTAVLLVAGASLQAAPKELRVVSATPKGALSSAGRTNVSVTFNQPVAALSEAASFASKDCPIELRPAVEGSCRTSGTQTVVFEPADELPVATRFEARVKAGFASKVSGSVLAQDYDWNFTTQTPRVNSARPSNGERWIDLNPTLYFVFNMPVDFKTLGDYMELSYMNEAEQSVAGKVFSVFSKTSAAPVKKTVPLQARSLSQTEFEKDFSYYDKANIVAVSVMDSLKPGVKYTFAFLPGLKAAKGGEAGLAKGFETVFYTYPPLAVAGTEISGCLPYTPSVHFSSPVRMRELVDSMEVTPASAVRQLSEQELDVLGQEVIPYAKKGEPQEEAYFRLPLAFLDLKAEEPVQIKIGKNLRDIYGNALGKDYAFTVTNEGYCPKADFSGGFGVLESYLAPRLPVKLMNIASLPVRAARFSKENFIPFNKESVRYCSEAELADLTYNGDYKFKSARNKTVSTFFDLNKFKPTAKDSIVFSQVKVPSSREEGYCWVSSTDNITDLGVTFKTSPDNILLWVTSLKTAEPQANLTVELRGADNKVLWTGSTDTNGLATAPGWRKLDVEHSRWSRPEIFAFVSSTGGDAVVSSNWNDGLEPWRFNINYDYAPQEVTTKISLFSDRGVYRPGEPVYLKGVVRSLKDGAWTLPAFARGTVKIFNSRGEEAFSRDVTVSSAMGTFDLTYDLPKNAYTGSWDASFTPLGANAPQDTEGGSYSFQVEAVKQADFKVSLRADKENYLSGADARFMASAQYQFGSPLADAPVKWNLRQSQTYFTPKGFSAYEFTPYFLREEAGGADSGPVASGSGKLDAKGSVNFEARLPKVTFPVQVYAEAGVQSPARQELFSRASVLVHPAAFYLGAKLAENNAELGDTVQADIAAVTPDGVRTSAVVTAEIRKEQWMSVRKNGLAGRLEWVSEKKVTPFGSKQFTVGTDGYAFSFKPAEAGNYFITLTSQDSEGRKVRGGFNVMVYGKGEAYWKKTDDDILKLSLDKDSYKPGKTAKIRVESPYPAAQALVTVEREGVLDAWTQTVRGGADFIEVPVKPDYLPNVYVSVTLVSGRAENPKYDQEGLDLAKPQGKMGYVNLKVTPETRQIKTTVKTNKEKYLPGEEVTVSLNTKVKGKGVPAEVVVMAVDEGVLSLTAFKTPDLFEYFYGPRALSVSTMDNRVFVIGQRSFGEKGENRGGGGADSKLGGADLRSNFVFTPYFNAAVTTDKKGRGEVKFKLPDNLTEFRIMAVSLTRQDFGSSETKIKVSKPLMITSNMPRFARKGDRFSCGAVVYNYEDKKGEITVTAQASGAVKLTGAAEQTVYVEKGKAKEASWPCEAVRDGEARVSFASKAGKASDGVISAITVSSVEKPQTLALYSATEGEAKELLERPANLNPAGNNAVGVSAASTALLNLKGSMLYLLTYPYDCLEQKMSKIRPVISGAQLVEDFGLGSVSEMKTKVQDILDEMGEYQYPSGGLAYWKGAKPDPYVTAYALETARLAQEQGYRADEKVLQNAAKWLRTELSKKQQTAYPYSAAETAASNAYSVYVLALYGENMQAAFNNLYEKHASLTLVSRAYLLKAAQAAKRPASVKNALAQSVLNTIVVTPQGQYFDEPVALPWLHVNNAKATALAMDALLYADSDLPDPYKTVRWLMTQMNAQGHWNNTSVNAAVFAALNAYYRKAEGVAPDFAAQVKIGLQTVLEASFKGRTLKEETASVPFAKAYANGAKAQAVFSKTGPGTLFYTLSQTYEPLAYDRSVNAGFEVSRAVTDLNGKPVSAFSAGQRYKVTLTVKTSVSRQFAVLEDFIPAGFEIVNTNLATESASQAAALDDNYRWGGFERSEKYDDRIAAFADWLEAGEHTFSYLVSASVPGTFAWPSAWTGQMYEPAVFGRNATGVLVIKPS